MSVDRTPKPCLHLRADHQHGTYLAYLRDGCRCWPCVGAGTDKARRTARATVMGTHSYVDAEPARVHVRELLATLTVAQVEQRSGVHRTAIRVLVGDFPGRPASKRITRTTEARLLAVTAERVGVERTGLVDGTGTRRRVRALIALGWPARHLQRELGKTPLQRVLRTDLPISEPVRVSTRDAVRELYDQLSLTMPPPSRYATRARRLAATRGWAPPLAWEDETIDDPQAKPNVGRKYETGGHIVDEVAVQRVLDGDRELARSLHPSERAEVVRRLAAAGHNDQEIERRTGISHRTALRVRHTSVA